MEMCRKSLESYRFVEEFYGHLPSYSFALYMVLKRGKKRGEVFIQCEMKTFKPEAYDTWDYLNTR